MERDWTFFILGTTRPDGVAMAIPILLEPMTFNSYCDHNQN
jgi:hypothetical protein